VKVTRENSREKFLARERTYRAKKRERLREYSREWRARNRNRAREISQANQARAREKHPERFIMRNAITHMLRGTGITPNCRSQKYIGCTPAFLRNHLEEQFLPGMTWENYGSYWHVDHIVPLAWWDIENIPEHIFYASHYSNLRPLPGIENASKGARFCLLCGGPPME
jgi:hypothetical protein